MFQHLAVISTEVMGIFMQYVHFIIVQLQLMAIFLN